MRGRFWCAAAFQERPLSMKKGLIEMKGIMIGGAVFIMLLLFVLYCCVRVGGQADRHLEEMDWEDRYDRNSR